MSRGERPALTEEYLTRCGTPSVITPAKGVIAVVSGDGFETVDMTAEQVLEVSRRLIEMYVMVGDDQDG